MSSFTKKGTVECKNLPPEHRKMLTCIKEKVSDNFTFLDYVKEVENYLRPSIFSMYKDLYDYLNDRNFDKIATSVVLTDAKKSFLFPSSILLDSANFAF